MNKIIKNCPKHGETDGIIESNGYIRCKKCRAKNVADKRRKNKRRLIDLHGGKCVVCGYDKSVRALHFHHLDPNSKSYGIAAKGISRSFRKQQKEAEKCILLCSNCHCEVEDNILDLTIYLERRLGDIRNPVKVD